MPASPGAARLIGRVGLLLVVVGLAVAAYVGWLTFGTTWQSERRHDALTEGVERRWDDGEATFVSEHGEVAGVVRIPAFGDDYAVPVLEGTTDEVLAAGFGHFEDSAGPGEKGNFALAAHRVTHGEPLRDMPLLEPGDEVVVETREWVYTYVLDTGGDDLEVPFTETWVLDDLPRNPDAGEPEPGQQAGQRLLTLTTCAELFNTDQRLIAFGHLESRRPADRAVGAASGR
jgi:sortase A